MSKHEVPICEDVDDIPIVLRVECSHCGKLADVVQADVKPMEWRFGNPDVVRVRFRLHAMCPYCDKSSVWRQGYQWPVNPPRRGAD